MPPIKKTISVPLPPDAAFQLFTARIDLWWPKSSHSLSGAEATVTFPDHLGGDIIEHAKDGTTHIWGTITGYDEGAFLSYIWHPGRPKEQATVVTISFTATETGTTLVLTHGGFEILGPTADAVSTSYLHGWDLVLGCYAKATLPVSA